MRYVSIQQTIQFSICKISDIGYVPSIWTVLVKWYPHYGKLCRLEQDSMNDNLYFVPLLGLNIYWLSD